MQQKRIKAKKSLGQHFLNNPHTIRRIVDSLDLKATDTILEIGCGTGALTKRLVGTTRQYLGVELDTQLFQQIERTMTSPQAVFFNQNILTLNWDKLQTQYLPSGGKFKVVGNLPYNISSPIITQLAQHCDALEMAVIMLQAEVADRLMALPGSKDYGVLTLLGQYYFKCEFLLLVRSGAFRPQPKVISNLMRLTPKPARRLLPSQEAPFLGFVKRCFSQRRKTLRNCLKGFHGVDAGELEELLKGRGYTSDVRAERISLDDFIALYMVLANFPARRDGTTP
jgi:16S rRNA (adenine1518-N6/adenine1519-N6)-dimethyltransferase